MDEAVHRAVELSVAGPRVGRVTTPSSAGRIARVALDVPLAHLDRFFDYRVSEADAGRVRPGVRVQARFAGRRAGGFVVDVVDHSEVIGELQPLERVISDEVVLSADQVRLLRAVADHWGGTFADVMRLAVPPRHAATEATSPSPWPMPTPDADTLPGPLDAVPAAAGFLAATTGGAGPRAFWQVPPVADGPGGLGDWTAGFAQAAAACLASGRRVLIVVPDVGDLELVRDRFVQHFGAGTVAALHADLGPSARYRQYLAVARGAARLLVGTRSAVFATMPDCGLVAVWDEGNDLLAEPRAPYPHARDVAAMRASQQQAALLLASRGRSAEVQRWVESGWLATLALDRADLRRATPAMRIAGADDRAVERDPLARQVRLPAEAFATVRTGLAQGPVLVQVARAGYVPALTCATCGERARCGVCHGPLLAPDAHGLACGWCGRPSASFRCPTCRGTRLRAVRVGSARTGEELGRAFPGVRVVESSGDHVVAQVGEEPAIVVATQGAEPRTPTGYAAALVLDTVASLSRPDLRAGEESLRRWLGAVGLVRPGAQGGTVCAVGPSGERALQALVRLDPATFAARELTDRREAGFPPAARMVQVDGQPEAVAALVQAARLRPDPDLLLGAADDQPPEGLEIWGPVPLDAGAGSVGGQREGLVRLTLRAPLAQGAQLVERLRQGQAIGSARHALPVRVRVDPAHLA